MDTVIVQQFLDFFQDFVDLCQKENWPENDTTDADIKKAFQISQHVKKCLDRLQKRGLLNDFLSVLNSQDMSNVFLKSCLTDPPKYVLQKIINSNTKISIMDSGFKVFLELFPEENLETYLTDFMVEAASKEALLKNLPVTIPKEKILELKSHLLLSELQKGEDTKDVLLQMLDNINQDIIDMLVVSLLNKDMKCHDSVNSIVNLFIHVMSTKNHRYQQFWKLLFNVQDEYLIRLCIDHSDLFKYITEALLDCGKLLQKHMSAEYFYINLTYSELKLVVGKIFTSERLKAEFIDIVQNRHADIYFWRNALDIN